MMKRTRTTYENSQRKTDYVVYGTPLPTLDSNIRDDGSFVPIWKQEVTDERGRKRLHGAFTGGFSAGYFNTVGSKEGWTPSTFKSSKNARAKAISSRPEDFMDEEDFAAAAEDKVLETNRQFTGLGSTTDGSALRSTVTVMDIFKPPPEETMGIKLLRKMGWKDGQGIGPKVRRAAVVSDNDDTSQNISESNFHFFAPKNSELISIEKKANYSGLGYTGNIKQESLREQRLEPLVEKKPVRKGGFGVGILNDEDEDDEDVYEIKPKSAYNRVIGGEKKKSSKTSVKLITPTKHVFTSKKSGASKSSSNLRKCFDGRLPLSGFVLASESMQTKDGWYPPPEVPEGWAPAKSQPGASQKAGNDPSQLPPKVPDPERKLDPRSRGAILGETPLPGKSVFDFMSTTARERIAVATGKTNLPPALNEAPPPGYSPSSPAEFVPRLDKAVALGALNGGFMPYADDMEKRARYRKFLEVQAGLREGLPDKKSGMSNADWATELNEFVNCARIFKPASSMISSRFTSSASAVSHIKTSEGVVLSDSDVLIHRPQKKELTQAEQAAKMGMYGGLTRTIEEFWPTRLLCKRFNVRPPKHVESATKTESGGGGGMSGGASSEFDAAAFMKQSTQSTEGFAISQPNKGTKELITRDDIEEMIKEVKGDPSYLRPTTGAAGAAGAAGAVTATQAVAVDMDRNEALEGERAADDVFRAIFGDDGDDDDDL